ncbi:MAG: Hsp20/alpha crystallin family protein [Parcubacteria group bacterium]|nr:Hsp20/alpha crystallin family protein [Parcubacteria group bacterium]
MSEKKSFLARLTGLMEHEDDTELLNGDEEFEEKALNKKRVIDDNNDTDNGDVTEEDIEEESEGELAVDVFQKPSEIVVKAMVAGVRPEDLDVALTREMVTIKGKRDREKHGTTDEYSYRELYWGAFARSLVLPEEVDVDNAEANVQNGLLIIRLPKIDKKRTQKLKILKA